MAPFLFEAAQSLALKFDERATTTMYDFQVPVWAKQILVSLYFLGLIQCAYYAAVAAYEIRLYAINEYGRVIHEFDPYFNYRAAEYLWANGWKAFREWFDYLSWYPLGRPVGTTMYPGMQITSCFIKKYILPNWSINDICVFVPAWFGVLATASTALLAYECTVGLIGSSKEKKTSGKGVGEQFGSILSDIPIVNVVYEKLVVPIVNALLDFLQIITGSTWGLRVAPKIESRSTALSTPALECALFTAAIMSIVPAHLLRSVGGGYDNESVATFAMTLTFYCWTRSLRGNTSEVETIVWGVLTGLAYFYMVMAWGGYVFVLNLIGVHAGFLVLLGRYSTKLHRAYTVFYVIGTILAIQIPVVGLTPLKSLEQLGAFVAFGGLQLIEVCEIIKRQRKLSTVDAWKLRVAVFGGAAVVAAGLGAVLAPTGYFGPVSARVRGLFVKHTKTGNPLVDSVAEHQAASKAAYFQYLNHVSSLAPVGFGMVALFFFHDASSFLIVYGFAAYFFSHRMVRLILLTAPIASVLAGIVLGHAWAWLISSVLNDDRDNFPSVSLLLGATESPSQEVPQKITKKKDTKTNGNKKGGDSKERESKETVGKLWNRWRLAVVLLVRVGISVLVIRRGLKYAKEFKNVAHDMAHAISHPTIIAKARTQAGEEVMVDDYREAYWWLRDHTAEDARIMAWWDYGYQITGISNRTTLADGNTWNHEHIALLGRTLTATEKEAHRIARHLADYVLVWAGGGGDDLAKSPHLRRIANSVYRHICPGDPTCRAFGIMVSIFSFYSRATYHPLATHPRGTTIV